MISTRISTKRCSKCLWRREPSQTLWDRSLLRDICSSSAYFVLARLVCLWRLRKRSNKGCSIYIICFLFVLNTMFFVCLFFLWKRWFSIGLRNNALLFSLSITEVDPYKLFLWSIEWSGLESIWKQKEKNKQEQSVKLHHRLIHSTQRKSVFKKQMK